MSLLKRTNPEYIFEPEMKRLSIDDSDEFKERIQGKTMRKLFEGARRTNALPMPPVDLQIPISASDAKGWKQTTLQSGNNILSPKKAVAPYLMACLQSSETCYYCERLSCFTPLNQCVECSQRYCSNCSFLSLYSGGDKCICKSCYR